MQANQFKVITLDGGAASGKSTTAKAIANKKHYLYVDSGGHYRAVTYMLLNAGLHPEEKSKIIEFLKGPALDTYIDGNFARIKIGGHLLEDKDLRSHLVNANVSLFAAIPEVRKFLFEYQRKQKDLAIEHGFSGIILEGRDMGSVVYKDADLHYFLEADANTRALRREKQGQIDSIAKRDAMDSSRKTAPLVCPENFIRIDTSRLSIDEVVATIISDIEELKHGG